MRDEARLATLRQIGFTRLIDMADESATQRLSEIAGDGFDIAIEAAGAPTVVDQALSVLKPWGILALAGMPDGNASFNVLRVGAQQASDSGRITNAEIRLDDRAQCDGKRA
ncbi:MAG: zinc-binding dehydrogenase [Rhizomicrobium sp.]